MSVDEEVVLVVGSGLRLYREYLLSSASTVGPLWLFNDEAPTWQQDYVVGSTVIDLLDRDAVVSAGASLAASRVVRGVLSWDERLIVATAHLAERLGLPGASAAGVEGCRDKRRNREVLTRVGLPQPRFGWTRSEEEAVSAAEAIGYPVVVKPRGMGASIGVLLAARADEVRRAFHIAEDSSYEGARAYHGGALIEEYVAGPEISIDAAVLKGHCVPMFLARKQTGLHPYFEELGHTVSADDPLLDDPRLLTLLEEAHRAIGFSSGITHTEVKLSARGYVIVEINGRLGGDLIPYLGRLATGIDPGVVAAQVATGQKPDLTPARRCTVGIRFGYPAEDCRVQEVTVPPVDPARGLLHAQVLADPGTELRLPPGGYIGRHAYVICEGTSHEMCLERLDAAIAGACCKGRPLERTSVA